jgi:sialidase-1
LTTERQAIRTAICNPNPTVTLFSITSNDPDDDQKDIRGAAFGTDDRVFLLRARKADRGKERIYTITYQATDHSGNTSTLAAVAGGESTLAT